MVEFDPISPRPAPRLARRLTLLALDLLPKRFEPLEIEAECRAAAHGAPAPPPDDALRMSPRRLRGRSTAFLLLQAAFCTTTGDLGEDMRVIARFIRPRQTTWVVQPLLVVGYVAPPIPSATS